MFETPNVKVADIPAEDNVVLRCYQEDSKVAIFREFDSGVQTTLLVLPTGTGKSVVFSAVIEEEANSGGRILVLAHRRELIDQAIGHAKAVGHFAGKEMGTSYANRQRVICSSVQTLNGKRDCRCCDGKECERCGGRGKIWRMERFDPFEFSLLIIDEAHHATATTYRRVIQHFTKNPNCKVLGVTATPRRADKVGMHNVFESCAYQMDLKTAIDQGWLCPIRQTFVQVAGLSLENVKTKAGGDLSDSGVERAFLGDTDEEQEERLHAVAGPLVEIAQGRQTILFASGIIHAINLTAALNAYDKVTAECVIESTDNDERKAIVDRYNSKETQILVGCEVFTEGFDAPGTEIVANARPTKSESRYLQRIGRGTRTLPGVVDGLDTAEERRAAIAASAKPYALVIDFVGDSGRHKIISTGDVLSGEDVFEEDLLAAIEYAKESKSAEDMEELIEKMKQAREEREKRKEEARQKRLSTKTKAKDLDYDSTDIDLFGGEGFDPFKDYEPQWDQATQKQVDFLMKLGVSPETATGYSRSQAGAVITQLKNAKGKDYRITFGKYKGKRLGQLPAWYISWIKSKNIGGDRMAEQIRIMEVEKSANQQVIF
ncbi:DEAD/DEAH box helicase [Thalassoglobus neptunius]|nr:DEAD/DEAH box helicase [Thalassoglobus neptunius]